MDKKHKISYNPPRVTVVDFKVENGMFGSILNPPADMFINDFGDASWNAPSNTASNGYFGDGEWTGGSSFSSNSSFGSGSWDN